MEKREYSDLWEIRPDKKTGDYNDGEEEARQQACSEKWVEERVSDKVVKTLRISAKSGEYI